MSGLVMAGQLLLGLSILIVLHELGHFLAARAFGIKVEKFYLFFDAWGVKLFKFNYKGCEYGIGWLPLGGYVKIAGMIDESMDTEQLKGEPQPWEFRSKPAWQRLIVMLAGIIVNIILGIFIFWMLTLRYGETFIPNDKLTDGLAPGIIGKQVGLKAGDLITAIDGEKVVRFEDVRSPKVLLGNTKLSVLRDGQTVDLIVPGDILNEVSDLGIDEFVIPRFRVTHIESLQKGGTAEKAGLKPGDSLIAINNQPIVFWDQMSDALLANKNKETSIVFWRAGKIDTVQATIDPEGKLGIAAGRDISRIPQEQIKYGFLEALPIGAGKAWGSLTDNAKALGKVVTGQVKANKALSGPVGIARMFGGEVDWVKFWSLVGLLSMALALMNILPIPALDGGHALFLIVEMIKGKPLSDKFMERAQIVGFVIIVALMIFALGNDIMKAMGDKLP
ncbi:MULTISPECIES: RIP metalloprotease RseP [Olivibacter]|uniref:Zinc metalloprotease n=1 Tax=Olivibacter oleidegradans TaxID=760123 RepID=A0ABV6HIA5_9SPHI|nr:MULTISPECIES: RIP metalloprotease RseP [Olivibacter]QEL01501.1 RIP metalloprotease RseP [Olivibacter sp. LS-1]